MTGVLSVLSFEVVAGPRGFEPRTPGISRFMKAFRGPVLWTLKSLALSRLSYGPDRQSTNHPSLKLYQ